MYNVGFMGVQQSWVLLPSMWSSVSNCFVPYCDLDVDFSQCLGPFNMFDVRGEETIPEGSSSLVNHTECEMVVNLYIKLVERYPDLRSAASSIAIISPYKAQVSHPLPLSTSLLDLSSFTYIS